MLNRNRYRRLNSSMDRPNKDTIDRAKDLLLYGPNDGFLFYENVAYVTGQEFARTIEEARCDLALTGEYGTSYNEAWGAKVTDEGPVPTSLAERYDEIMQALAELAYDCMFYNVN